MKRSIPGLTGLVCAAVVWLAQVAAVWSAPRRDLPSNVKIKNYGNVVGRACPAGRFFAYAKRGVTIEEATTGRTVHTISLSSRKLEIRAIRWALDCSRLAYITVDYRAGGRIALWLFDLARRRSRLVKQARIQHFGFDPRGRLIYLTGKGSPDVTYDITLFRHPNPRPAFRVPNRHRSSSGRFGQSHTLHRRHLITTIYRPVNIGYATHQVWLTELASGSARLLLTSAGSGSGRVDLAALALAPAEDRLCHIRRRTELRCIDLRTGRERPHFRARGSCRLRFAGLRGRPRPFSPDGKRMALHGDCTNRQHPIYIYDFESQTARVALLGFDRTAVAFQDNRHLLVIGPRADRPSFMDGSRAVAWIHRLDLHTGRRSVVVADSASYSLVGSFKGARNVIYASRSWDKFRDLVRVDVKKSYPAPPPPALTTDGRFREHHENGGLRLEAHYRRGVLHGPFRSFNWNGSRRTRGRYRAGLRHGLWLTWRADGTRHQRNHYVMGQLHGEVKWWHFNNKLSYDAGYRNGLRHGLVSSYHQDGSLASRSVYLRGKAHGVARSYHHNGKIRVEEHFVDGLRHGPYKTNHNGGARSTRGHYSRGKPDGLWRRYSLRGTLELEGRYVDQKKHGPWWEKASDGRYRSKGNYVHGKRMGHWRILRYLNPDRHEEGRYVDGKKDGPWIVRDRKGTRTEHYAMGRRLGGLPAGSSTGHRSRARGAKAPVGAPCTLFSDCASNVCGGPGCGGPTGRCLPRIQSCPGTRLQWYCDCRGRSFPANPACVSRRYRHEGRCR